MLRRLLSNSRRALIRENGQRQSSHGSMNSSRIGETNRSKLSIACLMTQPPSPRNFLPLHTQVETNRKPKPPASKLHKKYFCISVLAHIHAGFACLRLCCRGFNHGNFPQGTTCSREKARWRNPLSEFFAGTRGGFSVGAEDPPFRFSMTHRNLPPS